MFAKESKLNGFPVFVYFYKPSLIFTVFLCLKKMLLVDELDNCNKIVGKVGEQRIRSNVSRQSSVQDGSKPRKYFPFKQGYPFVATLRVGSEGIQMTVDGKHITSFAVREVSNIILVLLCFRISRIISYIIEFIFYFPCFLFRLWSHGLLAK